jgi:chromosome segregation ATPase
MIHTGRGNSLSGLIRQGSPGPAIVRVTLLNEGPDAYCPEVYGKRITIERVITKSSGATYKIMDQYNKVILFSKFNILISNYEYY